MPGNKFMVIKIKELLKTAVFAVLGVIIIVAVVYFVVGKSGGNSTSYIPGVYTAQITMENGSTTVAVEVNKSKIKSVELIHNSESVPVFYPLMDTEISDVSKRVVKTQSTALAEGDSVSTSLILAAVDECVLKATK